MKPRPNPLVQRMRDSGSDLHFNGQWPRPADHRRWSWQWSLGVASLRLLIALGAALPLSATLGLLEQAQAQN